MPFLPSEDFRVAVMPVREFSLLKGNKFPANLNDTNPGALSICLARETFFWNALFVSFFCKPFTETVVHDTFLKSTETAFLETEKAYRAAEQEFDRAHQELFAYAKQNPDGRSVILDGKLFVRLNALNCEPVRARLEAARARALARRNDLLAERARLMSSLKLIS